MKVLSRFALPGWVLLLAALAQPAFGQNSSVGIYTDASGTTCSFAGNAPGVVTGYVVARPGADGVRAVRFAAPVPSCFGGIFVGDDIPNALVFVGDSQSGISISSGNCETAPLHVLTISYFRSSATATCCPYPVLAEAGQPSVLAVNCAGDEVAYTGVTSHFNADASCPCSAGVAPDAPSNPDPFDSETLVALDKTLSWSASDYDGDLADFDVYLGTSASPPLVASHVPTMTYQPAAALNEVAQYYWKIVARDAAGRETSGPVWQFTTRPFNSPPTAPTIVQPEAGAVVAPQSVRLEWHSSDIDNEALRYDLYLGTSTPPPLYLANSASPLEVIDALTPEQTYYWRVVVRDTYGHVVPGEISYFSTHEFPPLSFFPNPPTASTGVLPDVTLSWGPVVPDGEPAFYEVFFSQGSTADANGIVVTSQEFHPSGVVAGQAYTWRIRAHVGSQTWSGPNWHFSTAAVLANTPSNPTPSYDGVTNDTPTLHWSVANPSGDALTYIVSMGTVINELFSLGSTSVPEIPAGTLEKGTRYFWTVTTRKGVNPATSVFGPIWTFTVAPDAKQPPSAPANPQPADGAVAGLMPLLSWNASDPEGAPLSFAVHLGATNPPPFYGYTTSFNYRPAGALEPGTHYYWQVVANDGHSSSSGQVWSFVTEDNPVPVLFSQFDASRAEGGIRVAWKVQNDEALESYTLYRREEAAAPIEIARGSVTSVTGSYLDRDVKGGTLYRYELAIRTRDGDVFRSQAATVSTAVMSLALYQNHPNPFNPETTIRYDVPGELTRTRVRLVILDVSGRVVRRVVDEEQLGGSHEVVWDGRDDRGSAAASGVYFYMLQTGKERLTRKLVLLK